MGESIHSSIQDRWANGCMGGDRRMVGLMRLDARVCVCVCVCVCV